MTDLSIQNIETAGNGAKKNIPWGNHGMRHIPGGWGGIPSHDTKCVGCGATVTICRHYRLANLLVVEPGFSSVPPTHKINTPPMGRGYFLADGEGFPRTTQNVSAVGQP